MRIGSPFLILPAAVTLLCAPALAEDVGTGRNGQGNRLVRERPPTIYQLMVRTFGNVNPTRKLHGTAAENGVGHFADINEAALREIAALGCDHLWLTGVLEQATATAYPDAGIAADDPDLLKGQAGSPYAIKDYYDVCPDYAVNPAKRLEEFRELLGRVHRTGLKAIIDFVPNHVARSYHSDVFPDETFGAKDDKSRFFDPQNNFFYILDGDGKPLGLELPLHRENPGTAPAIRDGRFDPEVTFARVTGNNVCSAKPSIDHWYETVKLNYGFDFTDASKKRRAYPAAERPDVPLPDTWLKMDRILKYWQEMGVDGFRCDMAHMVPPEFWAWAVTRARERNPAVLFVAEAYDGDPARVPASDPALAGGNTNCPAMLPLLNAGFDYVYDDPTYDALKAVYDGNGWANDLDRIPFPDFVARNSVRYAENHDEIRLASKREWGGIGMEVTRPVAAILLGTARGARMVYAGQEVGEPAAGAEGFGGDDGRTTIFDYWSMPEMAKWVNGHQYDGGGLSREQKELRAFHGRLLALTKEPAFRRGDCIPLNPVNEPNRGYGRIGGETASGHWLYGFMRVDASSGQAFLCVVNLHRSQPLKDVRVKLTQELVARFGGQDRMLIDRLAAREPVQLLAKASDLKGEGILIPEILPLTPIFFEVAQAQ